MVGWVMTGKTSPKVRALSHEPTADCTFACHLPGHEAYAMVGRVVVG